MAPKGVVWTTHTCETCGHRADHARAHNRHRALCLSRTSKDNKWKLKVNGAYSCRLCPVRVQFHRNWQLQVHLRVYHASWPDQLIAKKGYSPRLVKKVYGRDQTQRQYLEVMKISSRHLKNCVLKCSVGGDFNEKRRMAGDIDQEHMWGFDSKGKYDRHWAALNRV